MEDKIKQFLASGKLEEYIYGSLDEKHRGEVEHYIKNFPAVNKEYLILQEQLEKISLGQAMKAPEGMKEKIMNALPDPAPKVPVQNSSWTKYLSIAGLAASLFFAWAWYTAKSDLKTESDRYAVLASECEEREQQIEAQQQQIAFFNSVQTQKLEFQGNQLASDFKATVFVNETLGKALISPVQKLELPKNKCLQLWGDYKGEMIPIAVLDGNGDREYDLKINPEFTSLNITIEEKTKDGKGQLHPDVSQLIASVLI